MWPKYRVRYDRMNTLWHIVCAFWVYWHRKGRAPWLAPVDIRTCFPRHAYWTYSCHRCGHFRQRCAMHFPFLFVRAYAYFRSVGRSLLCSRHYFTSFIIIIEVGPWVNIHSILFTFMFVLMKACIDACLICVKHCIHSHVHRICYTLF